MPRGGARKGAGRKKGTPNKLTMQVKDAILTAFENAGGVDYLTVVAKDDPKTFLALLGKIVPSEIQASLNHSGEINMVRVDKDDEGLVG